MNWTYVAAAVCILSCVCLCWLHDATNPRRHRFPDMPTYLRMAMFVTALLFLLNGVMLSTMAPRMATLDHVAAAGLLLLVSIGATIVCLTAWVVRRTMPEKAWIRLNWIERLLRKDPDIAPVPMSTKEASLTARALGMASIEPNAPPQRVSEVGSIARNHPTH